MRAEADEFEASLVRLALDQNQVGSDVTVAVITPFTTERMIEITSGGSCSSFDNISTASSNSESSCLPCHPAFSRL